MADGECINEREIDVIQLLLMTLTKWKVILIGGLCGIIAFGVYLPFQQAKQAAVYDKIIADSKEALSHGFDEIPEGSTLLEQVYYETYIFNALVSAQSERNKISNAKNTDSASEDGRTERRVGQVFKELLMWGDGLYYHHNSCYALLDNIRKTSFCYRD